MEFRKGLKEMEEEEFEGYLIGKMQDGDGESVVYIEGEGSWS